MKIVVTEIKTDQVLVGDADRRNYYGIRHNISGQKGFVSKTYYESNEFCTRSRNDLTIADGWGYESVNLSDLLARLLNENFEVFEFSNEKEFYEWLAQD